MKLTDPTLSGALAGAIERRWTARWFLSGKALGSSAVLALMSISPGNAAVSEAKVIAVRGEVTSTLPAAAASIVVKGNLIQVGSSIQTREKSEVLMSPFPASAVRVVENSAVVVSEADFEKTGETILGRKATLNLQRGTVQVALEKKPGGSIEFQIKAPQCVAAARGTKYQTAIAKDGTETITALEGTVRVTYTDEAGKPVFVDVGPGWSFILKKGADGKLLTADLVKATGDQLDPLLYFSKLIADTHALDTPTVLLGARQGIPKATERLEKQLGTSIATATTTEIVTALKTLVAEEPSSAPDLIAALDAARDWEEGCVMKDFVSAAIAALGETPDKKIVTSIVQEAVAADPRCSPAIVAAAVKAAPVLASDIVEIAVASLPDPTLLVGNITLVEAISNAALAALQELPPIGEAGSSTSINNAANLGLASNLATLYTNALNNVPNADFQALGKAVSSATPVPASSNP